MKTVRADKSFLVIAITALILTVLVGYIAIHVGQIYRQNFPYRSVDPVYYSYYNAKLSVRLSSEDRLTVAAHEWLENNRFPLRTVPLLLFAPTWLAKPYGHMATSLPMFFILLCIFGWTVYRRTVHLCYAVAVMSLLGATAYLYHPDFGIAVYWLDTPMSYLFGAAVLCLINSRGTDLRWLAGFAALAALTALSRYVAAVYVFFICAPLLAYYLGKRWWEERNIWQAVILPSGVVIAIIVLLAGNFLITHFSGVLGFYSSYGYAVGYGIQESLTWVLRTFIAMVSTDWMSVLAMIAIFNLFLIWQNSLHDPENMIISGWLAMGLFLLFGVILRVVGARHVLPTAVPLLLLACCAPVNWPRPLEPRVRRRLGVAAGLIFLAGATLAGGSIHQNYVEATQPSELDRADKRFENALAQILQNENRPIVLNVYFAEYAWQPSMVSFYQTGTLPLPAGQLFFNQHLTAWEADYPGLDPYQIADRIYIASTKWVDIAVALAESQQAMQAEWLTNDYSRIVAAEMTERLGKDPNWEQVSELASQSYGPVVVYRNLNSNGTGYEEAFHGGLRP